MSDFAPLFRRAAKSIKEADLLLITAGAGMGVDSGLPDFRGSDGFWKAYPPLARLGLSFSSVSTPSSFLRDPKFGWGFFGHRYHLYSQAKPHIGYEILRRWTVEKFKDDNVFVFTSNVDGHFIRSGFESVVECHGSINFLQCLEPRVSSKIWEAQSTLNSLVVDPETFYAQEPLPSCPFELTDGKRMLARPNILMFGDDGWVSDRTDEQEERLVAWTNSHDKTSRMVIIELGAGLSVPTVRYFSERNLDRFRNSTLIRINIRDPDVPSGSRCIPLPFGAMNALEEIDAELARIS